MCYLEMSYLGTCDDPDIEEYKPNQTKTLHSIQNTDGWKLLYEVFDSNNAKFY